MSIDSATQYKLNSMCPTMQKTAMGDLLVALQSQPVVSGDISMSAGNAGETAALVAANNVGINTCIQAGDKAAAAAGGSIYVLTLSQMYTRMKRFNSVSVGQVPAVSSFNVVGDAPMGGVAVIVVSSGTAAKTITLTIPGFAAPVVLTSVANGGGPTDSQFCIGAALDSDTASYLAELINNVSDAGNEGGCLALVGGPIKALAIGTAVVITSSIPGVTIASSNISQYIPTTDKIHTTTAARTMQPGLVLQGSVGVTATVPAAGDEYLINMWMQP